MPNSSAPTCSGAVLRSAKLDGVNFAGANLSAANLRYTSGEPCSLVGCQITSGTCELSAWDTTTITRWTCHGAELRHVLGPASRRLDREK